MSRGYDFLVVGVVWSIAIVIHYISVVLFQPESALYEIAASAEAMNGAERADLWFEVLAVYMPLMVMSGVLAWAAVKEYRRQRITGRRPV